MYLFDIDGTLLLTGGAGTRAINSLFVEHFGVEGAMDGVSAAGKTDDIIFQECAGNTMGRELTSGEIQMLLEGYLPRLRDEMRDSAGFHLMPWVRECLEYISALEPVLGIATGNVENAAHAKLERAGLDHYFSFGGYGSDSAVRAELVATAIERGRAEVARELPAEDFVVIGDTIRDVQAARACGARVIAVATGAVSIDELATAEPDALFESLEELPAWHERHFRR